MKKNFFLIAFSLVALTAIIYFSSVHYPPKKLEPLLVVGVTNFPLYDIARSIGGDKIKVVQIVPPGASLHTFELTPAILKKLSGVKLVFKIGQGLDDWTDKISQSLGGSVKIIDVSTEISLRRFSDGTSDPHYWLSLKNGETMARNITGALASLDPQNDAYYRANLATYDKKLEQADKQIAAALADTPHKEMATFHDAWYYFAERYDLNMVTSFEEFPGKEPTPKYLAEFMDKIKKNNITVIFTEPQFSSAAIKQIAEDLHLTLTSINPLDGGAAENLSYPDIMLENALKIKTALQY